MTIACLPILQANYYRKHISIVNFITFVSSNQHETNLFSLPYTTVYGTIF